MKRFVIKAVLVCIGWILVFDVACPMGSAWLYSVSIMRMQH